MFTNNTHCSSKTNRAHSHVNRHSSNFTFLPKHYFDIGTIDFFGGHVVSSDDRSIRIFATYSRNTTSVSPLRTHRKLGQLQEYDVTRIWKLRVQTSLVLETYELVTLPVLGQFWANYIPPHYHVNHTTTICVSMAFIYLCLYIKFVIDLQ